MSTHLKDLVLIYDGSVKRVWKPNSTEGVLWFEFTDDYSVFDWGKMPDTVDNKGRALLIIGSYLFHYISTAEVWQSLPSSPHLQKLSRTWLEQRFEQKVYRHILSKDGAPHHFRGVVSPSGTPLSLEAAAAGTNSYMEVVEASVSRPEPCKLLNQTVFHYPRAPRAGTHRLVPLEVVFRFGMPAGSSLTARLEKNPQYASELGLDAMPRAGELFDRPVLEFFTKLEPKDRLLSVQEALLVSGLSPYEFEEMTELAFGLALILYDLCARRGIDLWDGKFEFICGDDGLMLSDSIGPDELRLNCDGVSLSKEMIRQFYRGTPWERSLKEAQKIAAGESRLDWRHICRTQLAQEPKPLPAKQKAVVDKLYGVLANAVTGQEFFKGHPTLDEFVQSIKAGQEAK